MFVVPFWWNSTRWISWMNKERGSLPLIICICSSIVRNTNGAFWADRAQRSPQKKYFYCHSWQIPSSHRNVQFHARIWTLLCTNIHVMHSLNDKPLKWPDQITVLRDKKTKNKRLTWSYVYTEVYWYRILFLLYQKVSTFEQFCQII